MENNLKEFCLETAGLAKPASNNLSEKILALFDLKHQLTISEIQAGLINKFKLSKDDIKSCRSILQYLETKGDVFRPQRGVFQKS